VFSGFPQSIPTPPVIGRVDSRLINAILLGAGDTTRGSVAHRFDESRNPLHFSHSPFVTARLSLCLSHFFLGHRSSWAHDAFLKNFFARYLRCHCFDFRVSTRATYDISSTPRPRSSRRNTSFHR
jgi:hypothetical protein